ncbi:Laccase-2 [Dactylellina cionopaga]|nr:Laccase-2 [Dactylellina cionopaga]
MRPTLKIVTSISQHNDDEDSERAEAKENVEPKDTMLLKRKALFRSVLLLLAASIVTITVGALLTRLDTTFEYTPTFRALKGFPPSHHDGPKGTSNLRFHDSSSSNEPKSFMRDASEYVLSPPDWNRIRVRPQVKEYNWTISDVLANPDGVMRPMILINGQFPGPLIECNENDIVKVTVHNQATNATAFHWHGLFHNGSNWMDGTTGVTQCPIPPGESFTYEIKTAGQYGTYWYHSHFSTQYTDGLFGPLVIHSPSEPGRDKYKTDQVVMLHDHYHDLSRDKLYEYLAPDNENAEPIPDGALINGRNM